MTILLDFIRHCLARLGERSTLIGVVTAVAPQLSPELANTIGTIGPLAIGLLLTAIPDPKLTKTEAPNA